MKIIVPTGVVTAKEKLSQIEWVFRINSTEKCCPTFTTSLGFTVCMVVLSDTPAYSIFPLSIDIASLGP